MNKKIVRRPLSPQIIQEEEKKAPYLEPTKEPCVFLGKPKIDPAYQKQINRRKKRVNQPYFPSLDSLDVPPLLCPLEFDEEQND